MYISALFNDVWPELIERFPDISIPKSVPLRGGHGPHAAYRRPPPPKELVAKLSELDLLRIPNVGKVKIQRIKEWLAEDGFELRQSAATRLADWEIAEQQARLQVRINSAIKLLLANGYVIKASEPAPPHST